jgi:hypothetical protein
MQIGNEKEHQENKEEQGKRQEEIIADFRLAIDYKLSDEAGLLFKDATKDRFVNDCRWLKAVGVHIP